MDASLDQKILMEECARPCLLPVCVASFARRPCRSTILASVARTLPSLVAHVPTRGRSARHHRSTMLEAPNPMKKPDRRFGV